MEKKLRDLRRMAFEVLGRVDEDRKHELIGTRACPCGYQRT